MNIFDGSIN